MAQPDVDHPGEMTTSRRIAAIVALVSFGAIWLALIVFLVTNLGHLVIALVGSGVAAAGMWWSLTERGIRRALGFLVAAAGLAAIAAAVIGAFDSWRQALIIAVLVAILLGVAWAAARYALVPEIRQLAPAATKRVTPPRHPVLLCNPWSGGGKVKQFGLIDLAGELGIETQSLGPGIDLEKLARQAVADGADCLAMAGGDGSQALVASIAIEHDLPFICIAAGTRNHFALDLGLDRDDPREGMKAFRDPFERRIDYGTAGGRLFVNNVSFGVYAEIIQSDAYRDAKTETVSRMLPELLGRGSKPFDLQFTTDDGTEIDGAFLIQVSNNPYRRTRLADPAQRPRLDTGTLGIVAVSTETGPEAAGLVTRAMAGLQRSDPRYFEWAAPSITIRSRSGTAFAGVDGEALNLDTPLALESHPGGLRLFVPEKSVERVASRWSETLKPNDLFDLAVRGRLSVEVPPDD